MEYILRRCNTFNPLFITALLVVSCAAAAWFSSYLLAIPLAGVAFYAVLMLTSRPIKVKFSEDNVHFTVNGKERVYPKSDIVGFYSFNYRYFEFTHVSFSFLLTNGKRINITSYKLLPLDDKRHTYLLRLMQSAERELDVKPARKNIVRGLLMQGNIWFDRRHLQAQQSATQPQPQQQAAV